MLPSVCLYIMLCSIFTGTADFVQQFPSVVDSCEPVPSNQVPTCRKDLGEKRKLRLWSRGHLFIVRPCGHVDFWRPIYRYNYIVWFLWQYVKQCIVTVETLSHGLRDTCGLSKFNGGSRQDCFRRMFCCAVLQVWISFTSLPHSHILAIWNTAKCTPVRVVIHYIILW